MIALRIVLGAAPSVLLMIFFYLKDRYEPEPHGYVAVAFLAGASAFVPAFFAAQGIELAVGRYWLMTGGVPARLFETGVMAAGVEELSKWGMFVVLVYRWDEFDEPLDGLIYGVALALGLATVENVLYVLRDGLSVGLLRAAISVPAHALFGAAMGFYFGRAKLGRGQQGGRDVLPAERRTRFALALAVPLLLHTAFDFTLLELRGWWMYAVTVALSIAMWVYVLGRVRSAQSDSPFKNL